MTSNVIYNQVKPYVYRIEHPSGNFYIGYRYANREPAIDDFGILYKTSTNKLKYPFEEYKQIIIAEFNTGYEAYDFEQKMIYDNIGNDLMENGICHYGKTRFLFYGPHSKDAIEKISAAHRGRKFSAEHRKRLSEAQKKRSPITEETRSKMSISAKNKPPVTDEARNKMSESKLGTKLSDEHRNNISKSLKGHKKKKVKEGEGRKQTEETKRKISESQKGKRRGPRGPYKKKKN
jgi:hypothetical protein